MVSYSFQNFCFNIGEKYICFYSKWCYESFSVGPEVLSSFFQRRLVIMDLCRSIPIHLSWHPWQQKRYIFEKLNRGNQESFFFNAKQAGPFEVQIPTAGLIRISHYQAEWTNPGNEQLLCKGIIFLLYLRFCKGSNNLLKFSQDSKNLEVTISSQFVHIFGSSGSAISQMYTGQPYLGQSLNSEKFS